MFWQQHVSNQSIRERTKQPTASSLLRQRRLRWFGHLHRMPSSLPVRRVFDFNPNIHGWKRTRGRPKTRWADSVKHDLHSAGIDSINATQLVYDRPQWKAFVCGLPALEPEHVKSSKARRTYSRLCLLTTQLNRREQIRSRLVGVHCHDGAIQTRRFSQAI